MSLTPYPRGSLRELSLISIPLMISSLSSMAMLFVDRLFLANYSLGAMKAAVSATTLGWAVCSGWLVLSSISEVFVAQYNGANRFKEIGRPVWQMIWLGFISFLFFIPLSKWGVFFVFGTDIEQEMEREFFYWMMLFGPTFAFYGALCGFFVGRGKVGVITWLAVISNILNAVLDYLLIFGIVGFIPSMGVRGAAIATCGSLFFQTLILFYIFLKKDFRETFGTDNMRFDSKLFWSCLKVGSPAAVVASIELLGWSCFYIMMSWIGNEYLIIAGICQSIVILFYFIVDGVNKGVTTIAANLIGSKNLDLMGKVCWSGIYMHIFAFFIVLGSVFLSYETVQFYFLKHLNEQETLSLTRPLTISLFLTVFYLFLEGLRMVFAGILTAGGDTFFLMLIGTFSVWIFLVLPTYWIAYLGGSSIEVAISLWIFYALMALILNVWRYMMGKWKESELI